MHKLNICMIIAEIEKVGFQVITNTEQPFVLSLASQSKFDPIEDDGLCHRLMIKHEINLKRLIGNDFSYVASFIDPELGQTATAYSNNANDAICKAILKKNLSKEILKKLEKIR